MKSAINLRIIFSLYKRVGIVTARDCLQQSPQADTLAVVHARNNRITPLQRAEKRRLFRRKFFFLTPHAKASTYALLAKKLYGHSARGRPVRYRRLLPHQPQAAGGVIARLAKHHARVIAPQPQTIAEPYS
jgi:hypothetical protein